MSRAVNASWFIPQRTYLLVVPEDIDAPIALHRGDVTTQHLYDNRPDNAIEVRSRRHSGSTSLKVIGNPATKLKGYYWTDRDSCGDLEFVRRVSDRAEDFEGAEAFFG